MRDYLASILIFLSFSIFAQVQVDVNLDVNHTVGGVSTFEREKFITMHGDISSRDWDGQNFTDDLMGDFLEGYDAYFGRTTGGITWIANQVKEDPNRPGQIDVDDLKSRGLSSRNTYAGKTDKHQYEYRSNSIIGAQYYPFWPGSSSNPCCNGTSWKFKDGLATGEYMGHYLNEFFGDNGPPKTRLVEVMNEPMYHFVTHPSTFTSTPREIAEFHNDVADGIRAVNDEVLIGGYTAAFPDFEKNDFQRWEDRWKLFIDVAGEKMDFWSIHLYDFPAFGGKEIYRKGSNIEATFDMMEHYSMLSFGVAKPFVISEYGAQTHDFFNTNWSGLRDWMFVKSTSSMMMTFMDRPNLIEMTIPFMVEKAEWGRTNGFPHGTRLLRQRKEDPSDTGNGEEWVYTDMIRFFELWKNVKGKRVDSHPSDPDIQADAYVDGKKAFIVLNNLNFDQERISIKPYGVENNTLSSVLVRHLHRMGDVGVIDEEELSAFPGELVIDSEGTMVLECTFENDIEVNHTSEETKYYATEYLKPIVAGSSTLFSINDITKSESGHGEAVLRLGVGREHGRSLHPSVEVNGNTIDVPMDWKGYDQASRESFYGVLEIPVPYSFLDIDNEISVQFEDGGGHIASIAMQVFNFTREIDREIQIIVDPLLSSSRLTLEGFEVYPNPTKGMLSLSGLPLGQYKVLVYDIAGSQLIDKSIQVAVDSFALDLSSLRNGIYMLSIIGEDESLQLKVSIKK
ncbi:MAG: T9SS type A sorting domain-containing protein [Cyclobacteriaceae bacterium]